MEQQAAYIIATIVLTGAVTSVTWIIALVLSHWLMSYQEKK